MTSVCIQKPVPQQLSGSLLRPVQHALVCNLHVQQCCIRLNDYAKPIRPVCGSRACGHSTHQFQTLPLRVKKLLDVSTRGSTAAHCRHLLPHHLRVVDGVFPAQHNRHCLDSMKAAAQVLLHAGIKYLSGGLQITGFC